MEHIRSYLQKILESEKIAGMAVAVTDRKGILFAEGFGVESIERPEVKVTAESLFRIASITKIVTGMTILSLVEEGKLSLDAPIKEIIPWLSLKDKHTEKFVTLGHLLSHTSGLPAEYTPEGPREESALEESLRKHFFSLQIRDMTLPKQELWSALNEDTLRGHCLRELKSEYDSSDEKQRIAKAAKLLLALMDGREVSL